LVRAFGGAILFLVVALLPRSAPYPYWDGHISSLLDRIRGGHAEEYTLSVAKCPGLFIPSSYFLRGTLELNFLYRRLRPPSGFAQRAPKWVYSAAKSCWTSVQRVREGYPQSDHPGYI
jgi:hypothetical protein